MIKIDNEVYFREYKKIFKRCLLEGYELPASLRELYCKIPENCKPSNKEINLWRNNRSPQAIKKGEQMLLDLRLNPKSPIQELEDFFEEFPEFKIIIQE
ncbi:MAG: hypothetical protein MJ224_08110 [archaeon]|nr:hypothetical protein [archaeon]